MSRRLFFWLIVPLLLAGCAGSRPVAPVRPVAVDARLDSLRRAMAGRSPRVTAESRYTDGALWALRGDLPQALVAYLDAVRLAPDEPAIHHALSETYAAQGALGPAQREAELAVQLGPGQPLFHTALGDVLLSTRDVPGALAAYQAAVRLDPDDAGALFTVAELQRQQGQSAAARATYGKVVDRFGPSLDALYPLYQLQLASDDKTAAVETLETMVGLDPSAEPLVRALAELLSERGQPDRAASLLETLLQRKPGDLQSLSALSGIYGAQGRTQEAEALVRRAIELPTLTTDERLAVAGRLFDRAQTDSSAAELARDLFRIVRDRDPADYRGSFFLALLDFTRHDLPAAEAGFRRTTELAPAFADGWVRLGLTLSTRERWAPLASAMDSAVVAVPGTPQLMFFRGFAHLQLGHDSTGTEALESVLRSNKAESPLVVDVCTRLAAAYEKARRYDDSKRVFERGLAADSTDALLLNNFSYSLSERDVQLDRAAQMARRAVDQEPTNPSYLDTLGWALFKLGKLDEAAALIQRSLEHGGSAVVTEHLGDIYDRQGRADDARRLWTEALRRAPGRASLERKLAHP